MKVACCTGGVRMRYRSKEGARVADAWEMPSYKHPRTSALWHDCSARDKSRTSFSYSVGRFLPVCSSLELGNVFKR